MYGSALRHMNPNIQMVAQAFPEGTVHNSGQGHSYLDLRVYEPGVQMEKDMLYLVRACDAADFPGEGYASVCPAPVQGNADKITVPGFSDGLVLERALGIFSKYRSQEQTLDELVYQGCSLQELCEAGAEMLGNPVYIHDDWFMMLAQSSQTDSVLTPEYTTTSQRGFLPKVIVDDLQFDSDYLETFSTHQVQHWHGSTTAQNCLYVNLWDGSVYRGRLLVIESNHECQPWDERLAEVLAQRVLNCRDFRTGGEDAPKSMDDVIWSLFSGKQPESVQLHRLLDQLNWEKNDPYVCMTVAWQEGTAPTVQEHSLHSDLFRAFPNSYVLLQDHRQYVVLNMRTLGIPYHLLRYTLAPLCRDHLLYVGISAPVKGIRSLHTPYLQAEIALNSAFRQRNDQWVRIFSGSALPYILENYRGELAMEDTLSPALYALRDYDQTHGTPYFETLKQYLLCERDIPKTSETLIVHRTTLLYRLKKIQGLVSLDLDDPAKRLYLLLSLWVMSPDKPRAAKTEGE